MKKLLKTPLLPQGKATVAVSQEAEKAIAALEDLGIEVFKVEANAKLSAPVACHPDCNLTQIDRSTFICDEDLAPSFENFIKKHAIVNNLTIGQGERNCSQKNNYMNVYTEKICSPYPGEAAINVKIIDNCIVCNSKYISTTILNHAVEKSMILYHCNQGYVGCSSVLLSPNAAMTDDESLYDALRRIGLDCLKLSKGQIKLNGYSYGFIGGCCGFIGKNMIAFNGRLDTHDDAEKIKNFLNKYNVDYVELTEDVLTDIGGIVPIFEEI